MAIEQAGEAGEIPDDTKVTISSLAPFEGDAYPKQMRPRVHGRDAAEIGRFRPPTLRNIARTAPYMHDGRDDSLDTVLAPFSLSAAERDDLKAFLDSLTDLDALVDTRWSDPWRTPW